MGFYPAGTTGRRSGTRSDFAESARAWNASGSEFERQIEAVGRAADRYLAV